MEDLDKELIKRGANQQFRCAQTYKIIRDMVAENNGEIPLLATKRAEEIEKQLFRLEDGVRRISKTLGALQEIDKISSDKYISFNNFVDQFRSQNSSILFLRSALESIKECFGDEAMTENVICKSLELASYGLWKTMPDVQEKTYTYESNKKRI